MANCLRISRSLGFAKACQGSGPGRLGTPSAKAKTVNHLTRRRVTLQGGYGILALRNRILVDMGIANFYGLMVPYNTISHLRSQYRIDNYEAEATCVITNKTTNAPARGAGRVTAAFVIERVLERVARRLDLDPAVRPWSKSDLVEGTVNRSTHHRKSGATSAYIV